MIPLFYTIRCFVRPSIRRACVLALIFCMGLASCSEDKAPAPVSFVLKCAGVVITETQFSDELDLKLSAYPYDLKNTPLEYNAVVLDLVSVLSDEVLLMAAALDRNITVSSEELAKAEAALKADYPEDSFEQMLLENAISYRTWKNNLEKDMVIEKFMHTDLIGAQEITPDDVMTFYQQYEKHDGDRPAQPLDEAGLVRQLRMEKSQSSYDSWIEGLKIKYPVEINKKAVAAFLEKTK